VSLVQDKCEELEAQISSLKKEISSIDTTSRRSLEQAAEETEFKVSLFPTQLTIVILSSRRISPEDISVTNKMGNLRI
jgi:S-adenosylmethionine:tRNA-ribosyltransferase-isomerase (queuine synthetase)